jgi:hypothetical protein
MWHMDLLKQFCLGGLYEQNQTELNLNLKWYSNSFIEGIFTQMFPKCNLTKPKPTVICMSMLSFITVWKIVFISNHFLLGNTCNNTHQEQEREDGKNTVDDISVIC